MKSPDFLKRELNNIIEIIDSLFDKQIDAMCDGNSFKEQQYNEEISYLENKKEILEWVLN